MTTLPNKTKKRLCTALCIIIPLILLIGVSLRLYHDFESWRHGLFGCAADFRSCKRDFNYCADLLMSMYAEAKADDEDIEVMIFDYSGSTSYVSYRYEDDGRNYEGKVTLSEDELEHFTRVSDAFIHEYGGLGIISVRDNVIQFNIYSGAGYSIVKFTKNSAEKAEGTYYRPIGGGWYHSIRKSR